jgi:hypothetical protein
MRSGRELEADTSRDVQGNDPQTPDQDREIRIRNPAAESGTREALGSKGYQFSQRDRQTLRINNAVRRHRDFGARREPVRTGDLSAAAGNCPLAATDRWPSWTLTAVVAGFSGAADHPISGVLGRPVHHCSFE